MKTALTAAICILLMGVVHADSGGPYSAVPDLKKEERPPLFKIPATKEPIQFYLSHMAQLRWNQKTNEPDSFDWVKISGYHASFRVLGNVRGRELFEVRYVSDERIATGLDYADSLVILARGFDSQGDSARFEAIYFTTGGIPYDREAEFVEGGHKYGAIKITSSWSGTGPSRQTSVFIRGTEEFGYERYTP